MEVINKLTHWLCGEPRTAKTKKVQTQERGAQPRKQVLTDGRVGVRSSGWLQDQRGHYFHWVGWRVEDAGAPPTPTESAPESYIPRFLRKDQQGNDWQ